jgi:hypothetical protein
MRYTSTEAEVNYVTDDEGHFKKGRIVEVISQGAARIQLGENSHAIAEYSETGGAGTFHYPDEAKAVKAAAAEPEKKTSTPAAASSAKA